MAVRLKDVYGTCKKEMTASFDRSDLVAAVTRGKPGYANLNQLNVGSPGSDMSDMDDTADLEELLAQGSTKGPQMHPGAACECSCYTLVGIGRLTTLCDRPQASSAAPSSPSRASSCW